MTKESRTMKLIKESTVNGDTDWYQVKLRPLQYYKKGAN